MRVGFLFTSLVVLLTGVAAAPVPRPLTVKAPAASTLVSGGFPELTWTGGSPPYSVTLVTPGQDTPMQVLTQGTSLTDITFVSPPVGTTFSAVVTDSTGVRQVTGPLVVTSGPLVITLFDLSSTPGPTIDSGNESNLAWSGGTPPYSAALVAVGQDVSLQVLTQGSNDTSTFFSVDLPVGTAFKAGVKDSTGAVQFTAPVTVASASGTSASAVASLSASGTGDAAPVNTVAA